MGASDDELQDEGIFIVERIVKKRIHGVRLSRFFERRRI